MCETKIVVIGAGVSGLTTALLLSENANYSITIVAKHMPGDYDIELAKYTSPWAGADYTPRVKKRFVPSFLPSITINRTGNAGSPEAKWGQATWQPLAHLAKDVPEAGIHFQKSRRYVRDQDDKTGSVDSLGERATMDPWWKDSVPDFRLLLQSELPAGYAFATEYTSVCINTTLYLAYLVGQCRKKGVIVKRCVFSHVVDAKAAHHSGEKADIVINCTGLMASFLGGVEDKSVVPARGQTVLVRNDSELLGSTSSTEYGGDDLCYFMDRASGGGTILGGCYQIGNWDSQPDLNLAIRIMKRAVDICPKLGYGKGIEGLSIVRHAVGLRPYRKAGVRLEREEIDGVEVVHNYGHGGFGYQTSYGCSAEVVGLVKEAMEKKKSVATV